MHVSYLAQIARCPSVILHLAETVDRARDREMGLHRRVADRSSLQENPVEVTMSGATD
jgi:hypothetical protein